MECVLVTTLFLISYKGLTILCPSSLAVVKVIRFPPENGYPVQPSSEEKPGY